MLTACQAVTVEPAEPNATSAAVSSTEIPSLGESVELRFACPRWFVKEIETLAETFHQMYPHITVEIIAIEDLLGSNGMAGDPVARYQRIVSHADVGLWNIWPRASRLGLIRNLAPFVEADAGFDRDDFYPFTLEYVQWDDGLWHLPLWMIPKIIVYNKELFDQAGLAYPLPGWDQSEFLHLARQLTIHEAEGVTQYGYAGTSLVFTPMMKGLITGSPFNYPALNTPQVAQELQWYTDLVLTHGVNYVPGHVFVAAPNSLTTYDTLRHQGRIAMWETELVNLDSQRRLGLELGIAPFPMGEYDANLFSFQTVYFMSTATVHPQESWQWMTFLSKAKWWRMLPAAMSPRRSVMEQTGYWAQWTAEEADTLRYALDHPLGEPLGMINLAMQEAADAVLQGQPVDEALVNAQQKALESYEANAEITPIAVEAIQSSTETADRINIVFASQGMDAVFYTNTAAAFNTTQEVYQVEVVPPQSGQLIDCFIGPGDVNQLTGAGQVLNIRPFLDAEDSLSEHDFAFSDALRSQGDLRGLPAYAAAMVLYYDPVLFEIEDLDYPQPGWTLDDFLHAARVLTQGKNEAKQYGFLPLDGDASVFFLFLAIQGAELWDTAGNPNFDAPDVVAAVSWYADLAAKYGVMPASPGDLPVPTSADLARRQALVQQRRVAMWTDLVGLGQAPVNPDARMAPLPGEKTLLIPYGLFIAADSLQADGCWEWLVFATTNSMPAPELGIPAYKPALLSEAFAAQAEPDTIVTFRTLSSYDYVTQPSGPNVHLLLEALAKIYQGVEPQMALVGAQDKALQP
jgi:ABC-type glycerol-3-phosphate transport system substrate-binding protein